MWQANAGGQADIKFEEENWNIQNITFKALASSANPLNPLGYIYLDD